MVDTHSSPTHEKPNLDALFPELRKQQQQRSDTQMGGPRFMAPSTTAAALLGKSARQPVRAVPPPPSGRSSSVAAPPAPSTRRFAAPPAPRATEPVEIEAEAALPTSPDASSAPIQPVDDDEDAYVDDGPTVLKPSPFFGAPFSARPLVVQAEKDVPRAPMPPPSVRSAAPPSAAKLPPPPSFAKTSSPSAGKLPPVPTPPSSLRNAAPSSYPSLPKATPVLDDEAETVAPPAVSVSSSSSRNATAASLMSPAAVPSQRYVPPSVPPPAPRPRNALETMPASSRFPSLAPTAASVPPPALFAPAKKPSRAGLWALAAIGTIGLAAAGGFFVTKGGVKALGLGSAGSGTLAISAAGPNNAAINGVRVFVDGAIKCEGSPCRIPDISTGTHFISVDAPGFGQTAARAVSVAHGSESALHIDLVPQEGVVSKPAPLKAEPALAAAATDDFKILESKTPAKTEPAAKVATTPKSQAKSALGKKNDAKKADEAPAAAPAGDATLNINSIPVASVVLDGRPVGSTPLVGVHVAPGAHSVVFIHPEKGRKAAGASVKAGGSATVAVRF